jgi:hypothetical protein
MTDRSTGRQRPRPDPWAQDTNPPNARRDRANAVPYMRGVYIALGSIVVLAVLAEFFFGDVRFVDRFGPNIATESLGILIVLVFVHRVLERQERAHRLRGSIGGLRKASRALDRLTLAWCELVKGTLPRTPDPIPRTAAELLEPHYAENLAHCDPLAMRQLENDAAEAWVRWAWREVVEAAAHLNEIVIAYSASLDPAYVEAIDELVDDPFIRKFGELAGDSGDARQWRVSMNAARALRESHFARIAAAIAQHNELARDAAAVRTRRTAPRTGTIGMELPLDHDLRAEAALHKTWWAQLPQVGALRSRLERESM